MLSASPMHPRLRRLWRTLCGAACAFSVTWVLGGTPSASATTLLPMDLTALSTTADRVLLATVEKVESHPLHDGNPYIVTDVTVRCERELLGVPAGGRFVVRTLGGVVGDIGQRVYGEANYRVGEQVLLFASERSGAFYTTGMAQGALHVYRDAGGVLRVDVQVGDGEIATLGGGPASGQASVAESGRALEDVLAQVRSLIERRAARTTPNNKSTGKGGQP